MATQASKEVSPVDKGEAMLIRIWRSSKQHGYDSRLYGTPSNEGGITCRKYILKLKSSM
jgi:hypothetical protein